MKSWFQLATIALVLLGSVSPATAEAVKHNENQALLAEDSLVVDNSYLPAPFKTGVNKVAFQSEGVKMVGNLYLPASYKPRESAAISTTGSGMSLRRSRLWRPTLKTCFQIRKLPNKQPGKGQLAESRSEASKK
jgi:hypothetical protein